MGKNIRAFYSLSHSFPTRLFFAIAALWFRPNQTIYLKLFYLLAWLRQFHLIITNYRNRKAKNLFIEKEFYIRATLKFVLKLLELNKVTPLIIYALIQQSSI